MPHVGRAPPRRAAPRAGAAVSMYSTYKNLTPSSSAESPLKRTALPRASSTSSALCNTSMCRPSTGVPCASTPLVSSSRVSTEPASALACTMDSISAAHSSARLRTDEVAAGAERQGRGVAIRGAGGHWCAPCTSAPRMLPLAARRTSTSRAPSVRPRLSTRRYPRPRGPRAPPALARRSTCGRGQTRRALEGGEWTGSWGRGRASNRCIARRR